MIRTILAAIILAFSFFCAGSRNLAAQNIPVQASETPDSTAVVPPSTEQMLKAKVDSLRNILEESSPARRKLSTARMLSTADSMRMEYNFPAAVELLKRARNEADTAFTNAIEESLSYSSNGVNMMGYCSGPTVIAKKKFPLKDFFLMYPMEDGVWRESPNDLDNASDTFSQATWIPENARNVYYSAKDNEGIRNIYFTHESDSLWSVPQLVNESLTSSSNEIYPMVSPDGRTLYFASKGLYGMGGYDLYSSRWNNETKDWEQPVNMGFPYSSPFDDFLFINTEDGQYSVFASNRECSADSVFVYVLEYDAMPLRHSITNVGELKELSRLSPSVKKPDTGGSGVNARSNGEISPYNEKMAQVRSIRDSVYQYNKELDNMRSELSGLSSEEQKARIALILEKETGLPLMQSRLDKAVKELQEIELKFLSSGVLPDMAQAQEEMESETVSRQRFEFIRHSYGTPVKLKMQVPEPTFDYSFKILPEGQFAESNVLPEGLIYQIQIATGSNKLSVKDLHGLSPVFEKMSSSLVFTYSVGIFKTYNDVLSHLNSVKKSGFKDAFITAYIDGKKVSIDSARSQEVRFHHSYKVRIVTEDGKLPDLAFTTIRQHISEDIAIKEEDGSTVYIAGPFDDRRKAESLVTSLRATGVTSATIFED